MAIFKGFFRRDDGAQIPLFTEETMEDKTSHRLDGKKKFQLNNWLVSKASELNGYSRSRIASMASNELGFQVNKENIRQASIDTGVEIETVRASYKLTLPQRVESLEADVLDLKKTTDTIADLEARVKVLEELLLNHVAGHPTGIHPICDSLIAA